MLDPTGRSATPILAPPSGFVAGLYAKTDGQRGVWKAPAGTSAALGGGVGLAVNLTDAQQGNLNPLNINVIRQFAGSGIVLWGARTVTSDPGLELHSRAPYGDLLTGQHLSWHPVGRV